MLQFASAEKTHCDSESTLGDQAGTPILNTPPPPVYPAAVHSSPRRSQLQILREAAGLSRPELAKRAGLSTATVYLLEDGLLDVRVSTLLKLSRALNVAPGTLLQDVIHR
jgi:DNA-binding XRE family transcriptional regulator